jgi:hypothetical protein
MKTDPATLLALGRSLGLQGFAGALPGVQGQHRKQPPAFSKEGTAPAEASATSKASSAMALAKSARLQCVANEAGAK